MIEQPYKNFIPQAWMVAVELDSHINTWIGVDLDGVLAYTGREMDMRYMIGMPVPTMVRRVQDWLASGLTVKIFTARMSENPVLWQKRIGDWCETYIGVRLEATNCKDFGCVAIYDDIAYHVIENTGEIVS